MYINGEFMNKWECGCGFCEEPEEEKGKTILDDKTLFLFGEITPDSTGSFIANFKQADSKPGIIFLNISCSGGWVEGGMCMYDLIKASKNQVITIGCGAIYSAAVLPFSAGDVRIMYKSTRMLLHDMSMHLGEIKLDAIKNVAKETGRIYDLSLEYLSKRSGMPVSKLNELCQNDTFLSADECKKMGLVDEVVKDNLNKIGGLRSTKKTKVK
jgi:ATP-dependent Clp protease, protease subunit